MKGLFVALLGIFLLFASARAEEFFDSSELDDIEADDFELLRAIEQKHVDINNDRENELARQLAGKIAAEYTAEALASNKVPAGENPCSKIHCSAGKICELKDNVAQCVCIPECPEETEPRRHVCTSLNQTMMSDCEVHRERCLCETGDSKCKKEMHHVHINYYGPCKELRECSEDEMKDFPRRMREWLFNVMHDLADRKELPTAYMEMVHEAETNLTKRWINAAVWKWCDLDAGQDRTVSRHELFPIRANLLSLESCIAPFFENCDQNGDHRITLKEWGHCLEVDDDELTERCVEINQNPKLEVFG